MLFREHQKNVPPIKIQFVGGGFENEELSTIFPLIFSSRKTCFTEDKSFGVIGFSNGGYLVSAWYKKALAPDFGLVPAFFILSGSNEGTVPGSIKDLSKNPILTFIIGDKDSYNRDPEQLFFKQLQKVKANVNLIEFSGGHELSEEALTKVLKK